MKPFVPVLFAFSALILAACGGGGGNPGGGTPLPPTPTPTATPSTTNASGVVVDDKTGSPLSGAKVALMPWGPCGATPSPATSVTPANDGCPTPLPSPQVTTDPNGNFTLGGVANGHYLLVIGNDVTYTPPPGYTPPTCINNCGTPTPAPFTVQAVVHDNVTLTGGNQVLKAPNLPTYGYNNLPTWETNGDYRLATLDAVTEMPCYIGWEYLRAQHSLANASVDEWLTENVHQANYARQQATSQFLKTIATDVASNAGGTDCYVSLLTGIFGPNPYASDPRSLWFGGQWGLYIVSGTNFYQGLGGAEFPIDPRSNTDPNAPPWI